MTRKLPDHTPIVRSKTTNYLSDADVEALKNEYGFASEFRLDLHLEDVAFWYQGDKQHRGLPKVSEQIKLVKAARDSARELWDALSRFGSDEILAADKHSIDWDHGKRIANIRQMHHALDAAAKELSNKPPAKGGRPNAEAVLILITNLRRIYKEGTGQDHRYTQDPNTYEYSGKFVKFVETVCDMAGLEIRNSTIGNTIKKTIQNESKL
jgi:hypothetical protein